MGKNGLIVVAWLGREEGGEQNPEEINQITFNGVPLALWEANINETGGGIAYLYGVNVPIAGTYTISLNFQDSPKQAEKKWGVAAAFSRIKPQEPEAQARNTKSGNTNSLSITPLTGNALVVASWSWRVGFANTWGWGTEIVTARGDNQGGVTLAYAVVNVPAAQTVSCTATNPEDNGLAALAFAMRKVSIATIM